MTGINALSDSFKGGQVSNASPNMGKQAETGSAAGFADILNASADRQASAKGRHSKAGRTSDAEQSRHDSGKDSQDRKKTGNRITQAALLAFINPLGLKSDLPAGKDANSGNAISQGTDSDSAAALSGQLPQGGQLGQQDLINLFSWLLNEVSSQSGMVAPGSQGTDLAEDKQVPQSGTTVQNSQVQASDILNLIDSLQNFKINAAGGNSTNGTSQTEISRLNTIAKLLETLAGEIKAISPGNQVQTNSGMIDLKQELAEVMQGWLRDPGNAEAADLKAASSDTSTEITQIVDALSELLAAENPGSNRSPGSNPVNPAIQTGSIEAAPSSKVRVEPDSQFPNKGTTSVETPGNSPVTAGDADKLPASTGGTEALELKSQQAGRAVNAKTVPAKDEPTFDLESSKDVQNPNLSFGLSTASGSTGSISNLQDIAKAAEGKAPVPVWAQISAGLSAQMDTKPQDLKQLEIQLHPADLGEILINLHWENEQMHLQVQASQASTGQLLQDHFSDLRQAFANQGINCGSLQMGQGGEQQQNSRGQEPHQTSRQTGHPAEDEEVLRDIPSIGAEPDGISRINVKA